MAKKNIHKIKNIIVFLNFKLNNVIRSGVKLANLESKKAIMNGFG